MPRVDADKFVGTELNEFRRCLALKREDNRDPPLSEHIDLTASKLRVTGSDCEKGLNWIVCDCANLGIYTATSELLEVRMFLKWWMPRCCNLHHRGRKVPGSSPRTDLSECPLACPLRNEPFLRWERHNVTEKVVGEGGMERTRRE